MFTRRCPICAKSFQPDQSEALPFCSPRCKQVDLGRWLGEQYNLPRAPEEESPPEAAGNGRSDADK